MSANRIIRQLSKLTDIGNDPIDQSVLVYTSSLGLYLHTVVSDLNNESPTLNQVLSAGNTTTQSATLGSVTATTFYGDGDDSYYGIFGKHSVRPIVGKLNTT